MIGTRLSGGVEYYQESRSEGFHRVGGIPGVQVTIYGLGGLTRQVRTNGAGMFEVFGLPPGTYVVEIAAVHGRKVRFPVVSGSPEVPGRHTAVVLESESAASVSFVLEDDTRVSGRMLDKQGNPIAGVCIDLEPEEGTGEYGSRFFNCSEKNGDFNMTMMPPGRYRLVAHDDVKLGAIQSKSTLYYPGVRGLKESAVITVEAGKYLENLDIRLPAEEKRFRISGRVLLSDGTPAPATVAFTSASNRHTESAAPRADGSFALSVPAGFQGQVVGELAFLEHELSLGTVPRSR